MLVLFISSFFNKNKSISQNKEPWYEYIIILILAPLVVLSLFCSIYTDIRDNRKYNKQKEILREKERLENERKEALKNAYLMAKQSQPKQDKKTYIDIA